jgi:hypothetical protein
VRYARVVPWVPTAGRPGPVTNTRGPAEVTTAEVGGAADQASAAEPAGERPVGSPGRTTRRGRVAATLRRHWLVAVLLAAGLVLRVLAQLTYRPVLFYIDTSRYLYNVAPGMDPLGYKGVLRAILSVANLDTVAIVQHLLGLAMAVVIYLVLLRRGAPRWLAALATAPVLLDAYQLQIEQTLMPDVWFEALIVTGLAIMLWRPGTTWRRAAAAGVALGTSALFAQVGEALLVPAVIYLLVAGGGWRRVIGRAAVLCVAFALPILAYETGSYLLAGNFFLSHTGTTSVYGRMAAAADCATLRLPPTERGLCPTRAQQAMGPDWLEFGATSPVAPYYANLPRNLTDNLIIDFNHRVLAQQPLRVLRAYAGDVVKLFMLTRQSGAGDTPLSRWQFQTAYPYFDPHASRQFVDGATAQFGGGRPSVWRPGAVFLRTYQLDGGYTPGPLFALVVVASLAGCAALLRRRGDPGTRQLALACLLLFLSGVAVLLASDVFEFSWRYQLPALVTLVPSGALGVAVVLRWARGTRAAPSAAGDAATR